MFLGKLLLEMLNSFTHHYSQKLIDIVEIGHSIRISVTDKINA